MSERSPSVTAEDDVASDGKMNENTLNAERTGAMRQSNTEITGTGPDEILGVTRPTQDVRHSTAKSPDLGSDTVSGKKHALAPGKRKRENGEFQMENGESGNQPATKVAKLELEFNANESSERSSAAAPEAGVGATVYSNAKFDEPESETRRTESNIRRNGPILKGMTVGIKATANADDASNTRSDADAPKISTSEGEKANDLDTGNRGGQESEARTSIAEHAEGDTTSKSDSVPKRSNGREERELDDGDCDDDVACEDDEELDLGAMRQHEYEQVARFGPAQLRRYESYRRSDLKKEKIKKVLTAINPVLGKTADPFLIAVKGLAKVFVGDVVEASLEVRDQWGDTGALQTKHLREAYRRLRRNGCIPSTEIRRDGIGR